MMNFGLTEPELQRWLQLRAIEWNAFPAYLSQLVAPVLFIFYPWWQVLLGVVFVGLVWSLFRYHLISPIVSHIASLAVVWLMWPTAIGASIYLFIHNEMVAGVMAIIWPFLVGLLGVPGKIGVIELRLAQRIGYVPPESGSETRT